MAILQIKGQTQGTGTITFTMPSTDEQSTVTLPAKSGTIALTSDIVETDVSTFATKTELSSGLGKKAEKIHTHAEADITGLTDKLGTFATTNALTSGLAGKANSTHSHTIQQITNLESTLSGKAPLANPTFTGTVTGTFKGNLTGNVTGNASSATKATQDASGNIIASTYLKSSVAATTYATKAESYTKNEIDAKVSSVYKYKGTVASKANLPSENQVVGDVYNVTDTGKNFAWDGNAWDDLGGTVDLTAYAKTSEVNSKLAKKLDVATYTSDKATFAIASTVNAELNKKLNTADAFTKATADDLYLGKTAKAASATKADSATTATSATKATQDASGNVITTTYATKTEMNAKAPLANPTFTGTVTISGGTFKGNLTGTADTAKSASAVAWANVSGKPGLIPTSGNAGTITTSETIANLQTVNASSPRSMKASSGATVTLQQGGAEAWITVIACEGAVTVNLGSGWAWSGSAPTLGKGLLTCAWYGSFGIVNFMKWGS